MIQFFFYNHKWSNIKLWPFSLAMQSRHHGPWKHNMEHNYLQILKGITCMGSVGHDYGPIWCSDIFIACNKLTPLLFVWEFYHPMTHPTHVPLSCFSLILRHCFSIKQSPCLPNIKGIGGNIFHDSSGQRHLPSLSTTYLAWANNLK